ASPCPPGRRGSPMRLALRLFLTLRPPPFRSRCLSYHVSRRVLGFEADVQRRSPIHAIRRTRIAHTLEIFGCVAKTDSVAKNILPAFHSGAGLAITTTSRTFSEFLKQSPPEDILTHINSSRTQDLAAPLPLIERSVS